MYFARSTHLDVTMKAL